MLKLISPIVIAVLFLPNFVAAEKLDQRDLIPGKLVAYLTDNNPYSSEHGFVNVVDGPWVIDLCRKPRNEAVLCHLKYPDDPEYGTSRLAKYLVEYVNDKSTPSVDCKFRIGEQVIFSAGSVYEDGRSINGPSIGTIVGWGERTAKNEDMDRFGCAYSIRTAIQNRQSRSLDSFVKMIREDKLVSPSQHIYFKKNTVTVGETTAFRFKKNERALVYNWSFSDDDYANRDNRRISFDEWLSSKRNHYKKFDNYVSVVYADLKSAFRYKIKDIKQDSDGEVYEKGGSSIAKLVSVKVAKSAHCKYQVGDTLRAQLEDGDMQMSVLEIGMTVTTSSGCIYVMGDNLNKPQYVFPEALLHR